MSVFARALNAGFCHEHHLLPQCGLREEDVACEARLCCQCTVAGQASSKRAFKHCRGQEVRRGRLLQQLENCSAEATGAASSVGQLEVTLRKEESKETVGVSEHVPAKSRNTVSGEV